MSVVIWARVSSREQREGYSLDAQTRAARERAERENLRIAREFTVAESAKRGAEREQFNAMVAWVKRNVRKEGITHILAHKLDRVCRNMRDAVRMQELEDQCGVKLMFVDNQFGPGAAGALSFNVMAAVAQYYSDNLRTEVLKGMNEKVRQGWLPANAPFGYRNVKGDKENPIQIDPDDGPTVQRIFAIYGRGDATFEKMAETLAAEGRRYANTQPRFSRTTLSYILNNRFYIGEIEWHGERFPGRHRPLIERAQFERCQDILKGRNRRTGTPEIPFSGGLFRCGLCGAAITGEEIRRRLADGGRSPHYYYKCRNTGKGEHPRLRWRQEDIEEQVVRELAGMRMDADEAAIFREALREGGRDEEGMRREQRGRWTKRRAEIKAMLERLLNGYLGGAIDEATFKGKSAALKTEEAELAERLATMPEPMAGTGEIALAAFDFSQKAIETWHGSNIGGKREILDCLCSNRVLTDVSLYLAKRKPFDVLAEGPQKKDGRAEWI